MECKCNEKLAVDLGFTMNAHYASCPKLLLELFNELNREEVQSSGDGDSPVER